VSFFLSFRSPTSSFVNIYILDSKASAMTRHPAIDTRLDALCVLSGRRSGYYY